MTGLTYVDEGPGWFGKLPTMGDFASRRLDPDFIAQWDAWLSAGMLDLRERFGSDWVSQYLVCPSWCFVLMPGVLARQAGESAWMGVLMPSVDRVGRYFPLTLSCRLSTCPGSVQDLDAVWAYTFRLDEICAAAMQDDWSVEQFEAALGLQPATAPSVPGVLERLVGAGEVLAIDIHKAGGVSAAMGVRISPAWSDDARGLAFWRAGGGQHQALLLASKGLPASAAELLGGSAAGRSAGGMT